MKKPISAKYTNFKNDLSPNDTFKIMKILIKITLYLNRLSCKFSKNVLPCSLSNNFKKLIVNEIIYINNQQRNIR